MRERSTATEPLAAVAEGAGMPQTRAMTTAEEGTLSIPGALRKIVVLEPGTEVAWMGNNGGLVPAHTNRRAEVQSPRQNEPWKSAGRGVWPAVEDVDSFIQESRGR